MFAETAMQNFAFWIRFYGFRMMIGVSRGVKSFLHTGSDRFRFPIADSKFWNKNWEVYATYSKAKDQNEVKKKNKNRTAWNTLSDE